MQDKSAVDFIYEFVRRYNGIDSNKANDVFIRDIVAALNRAYRSIIANLIDKRGDRTIEDRNHLRHLLSAPKEPLKCEPIDKSCCEIKVPDDYYASELIWLTVCHKCCDKPKRIELQLYQSEEIPKVRCNPHRRSDFRWKRAVGDDTKDGLIVYHDCAFDIKSIEMQYYKKIMEITVPNLDTCGEQSFQDWSGSRTTVQDENCLFRCDTYLFDCIVDLAVAHVSGSARDTNFQASKFNEIQATNAILK